MNKNIKLLWVADAISIFGSTIYTLALTLLSIEYTDTIFGAGLILFSSLIPYFIIGIFGGMVSDRVNRKKLMIICDIARGILTLSIPISQSLEILTVEQIVIVSFLNTCFRAFFHPASQACLEVENMECLR